MGSDGTAEAECEHIRVNKIFIDSFILKLNKYTKRRSAIRYDVFSILILKKVLKINANFRISYFEVTQQMMLSRPKSSHKKHNCCAAAGSFLHINANPSGLNPISYIWKTFKNTWIRHWNLLMICSWLNIFKYIWDSPVFYSFKVNKIRFISF